MRCTQCGDNNPDTVTECQLCHSPIKPYRRVILTTPSVLGQPVAPANLAPTSIHAPAVAQQQAAPIVGVRTPLAIATQQITVSPVPHKKASSTFPKRNQIQGRVIFVGQVDHQPEPFDWYALISRCLWIGMLVLSPFLVLCIVLAKTGVLTGLAIGIVTTGIGGMFLFWLLKKNPFVFIQTFITLIQSSLMFSLVRRGQAPTQPVRTLRIRDALQQQEINVTIKGHFSSGSIICDDEVTIWGHWSNGNFMFFRGINQRTGSHITLQYSRSKSLFWLTLLIAFVVGLVAYGSAVAVLKQFGH